jgi:uncharacterized protein YjbI with pentapeptide repeats
MEGDPPMLLKNTRDRIDATASNLSGSKFDDVNLSSATLNNVNLSGATIHNADLAICASLTPIFPVLPSPTA